MARLGIVRFGKVGFGKVGFGRGFGSARLSVVWQDAVRQGVVHVGKLGGEYKC